MFFSIERKSFYELSKARAHVALIKYAYLTFWHCCHCVSTVFSLLLFATEVAHWEKIPKFQVRFIKFSVSNIHMLFRNFQYPWVPFKKSLLLPAGRSKQAKELVRSAVTIGLILSNLAKLHWFPVTCAQEVSFYKSSVNYTNFIAGYFGNYFTCYHLQFYLAGFVKSFCQKCALKLLGNWRVILHSRMKEFSNIKYFFHSQKISMNVLAEFTIVPMEQLIA